MSQFLTVCLGTYGAVFIAEIVGDKLLYTTGVLATRYRSVSILIGMALAFTCKMAVAVAAGDFISRLSKPLLAIVTAASFIGVAIAIWRKPDVRPEKAKDKEVFSGALVAFAAIFLSEWGDVGQMTAVAQTGRTLLKLSAGDLTLTRQTALLAVWIGAVAAMVTKGVLAASLGAGIRAWIADRVSPRVVRYVATAALLILGVLAVLETLGILVD
jgi:putative Ca2+/H+ antiporter (TMEM165/GDT1 family)